MRLRLARFSILAVAIVACAWFGLGVRQAQEIADATTVIASPSAASASALRHAPSLLDAAGQLNPDAEVSILRGRLALAEHHRSRAQRILESVTRREPMNLEAWIWLTGASLTDRREAGVALAHIHELDPRS